MTDHDGFDFDPDLEAIPYNIASVARIAEVTPDGVTTSVAVFLADSEHPIQTGILLHPQTALMLASEIIAVAVAG